MTVVHIETGLPASGKSSHARSLGVMRFSLDDYRSMMGIGKETWTNEREQVAIACMIESARSAIKAGEEIVIDNTHLVPRLPRMYRKEFSPFGVTFQIHDFTDVSVEECIARDAERTEGHVGEEVIRKLSARHVDARKNGWRLTDKWMNSVEQVALEPYIPPTGCPPAIIVDLDGTVALHGDERGHYQYEKVINDQPNWPVIELVQRLQGWAEIIFLSGREDRCREDTEWWLSHYQCGQWPNQLLYMRTTGDHRPDYVIKGELFDEHIRKQYDVRLCLDDRDQVVALWRSLGLTCLQVADGDF